MNGGGAEHPQSEGWSFPCLFCGTQVTRVRIDGEVVQSFNSTGTGTFVHFWRGGVTNRKLPRLYELQSGGLMD